MDVTGRAQSDVRGDASADRPVVVRDADAPAPEPAAPESTAPSPAVPAAPDSATPTAEPTVPGPSGPAPDAPDPVTPDPAAPEPGVARREPVDEEPATGVPADGATTDLREATQRLRGAIAALPLDLDVPQVAASRRERELVLAQLDDYLLPRLFRMDAPLLAVIGGSTGAGKSTLTNSLARKTVSRSGVLRPTTRSPVLVHHPQDSGAFLTQRILPGLDRITSEALEPEHPVELDAPRITALRLVPHDGLSPGLALLDAPDIDSVVEANRDLAVQLLGAADLWLFVTTAARYGDAMPWEMLRTASDRGVSVAVVLDRVPPASLQEVRIDLARRLRDHGLGSSPMFVIPESRLQDGLLPANVVTPLHRWLNRLAHDAPAREVVIRRTLGGILESLPGRARSLVAAAGEQEAAAHLLGTELDAVFGAARSALGRRMVDGTVLRGEVLARWQAIIGSGELVRYLERCTTRFTDRIAPRLFRASRTPARPPTDPLRDALAVAIRAIVGSGVRDTVDQALARWQTLPGGTSLAAGRSASPELDGRLETLVDDWQTELLGAVRDRPEQPRLGGRTLTLRPELVAVLVGFVSLIGDPSDGVAPVAHRVTGRTAVAAAVGTGRSGRATAPAGPPVTNRGVTDPATTGRATSNRVTALGGSAGTGTARTVQAVAAPPADAVTVGPATGPVTGALRLLRKGATPADAPSRENVPPASVPIGMDGREPSRSSLPGSPPSTADGPALGEPPQAEIAEGVSLARRVLDSVYGENAVQALVETSRRHLRLRVEDLLNAERASLKATLDAARIRPGQAESLLAAVKVVEDAR